MLNATIKASKLSPEQLSQTTEPSSSPQPKASWNPILGVCLGIVIFFSAQIGSEVFLSYYRYPRHWTTQQILNWLSNSITAQFLSVLIMEFVIVLGICLFVQSYKNGFRVIGIRRPRWTDPLYGFAAVPVYLIIYFIAISLITHLIPTINVNEKQQLGFNNINGAGQMVMTFISLVILPPIAEEILFRGLIYSSLKKNLPTAIAVIGTSALFALPHMFEGGSAGLLYVAAIDTFILSLVLIYLRERTGGLWAGMTLHALKNSIAFVALYATFIH
jgi:membrane protease YdiL (CAAX protease family)